MKSARRAAYDALTAVTKDGAYTSLAIKENIPRGMDDSERRFASLLTRLTLENLIKIDYALESFIKSKRVHGSVRNILRLGACQIMFMDTEPYAAVDESVRLAKNIKPQASGFVNAVMRSFARDSKSIVFTSSRDAQTISVNSSYPIWMCEKYIKDFGYDFAEKILSYRSSAGTQIRMNTIRVQTSEFIEMLDKDGINYKPAYIENAYIVEGLTDIEHNMLYSEGFITVQSVSAMRAVLETGIKPGMKVLDCCAAPGGKSAFAAALTGNSVDITAWDVHAHRVEMMRSNFNRLGVKNATATIQDATLYVPEHSGSFDAVIIDAPCSASGLMYKSPDIRYARKPEDIKALNITQRAILHNCMQYVKPGGTLAYYTCSINKEENEEITDTFIQEHNDFDYVSEPKTLYPHICNSDGFYISLMKRKL